MLKNGYSKRYKSDRSTRLYPVEFAVRAFLGTYPGLRMPKDRYEGQRVLDLGYGDGRNLPLLNELGMKVHGVEISEDINRHVQKRCRRWGIRAVLKTGSNASIPFTDGYFAYVLACHSAYYVEHGDTFDRNLAEIARVTQAGGYWIASFPKKGSFILKKAQRLGGGHYRITRDPYGLRKGTIFRVFDSEKDIRKTLGPFFRDIRIGSCDDDYWGIRQKVWIVVCRRKS